MGKVSYEKWRDYLEEQVANGSIYLWGGQGEPLDKLTDSYIKKRETSESNAERVMTLRDQRKKKYPDLRAYDCSGLAIYYLYNVTKTVSGDMTANTIMSKCTTLSKAELKPGDFVFRIYTSGSKKGKAYHVGFVVDDGDVIEAKGRDYGVVKKSLSHWGSSYWNAYGRSPWIEATEEEAAATASWTVSRLLKKVSPLMTGDDVKNLQKALISKGYSCGGTGADGEFGKNTEAAVEKFQKAKGLQVDGIAGEKTVTALGGTWKESAASAWTVSRLLKKVSPLMKGDDVRNLQKALIAKGYSCGGTGADGEFGKNTEAAVEKFQKAKGLQVDGIAGENTVTALGGKWGK